MSVLHGNIFHQRYIVHLQRLDALFRAQRSEDLGAKHVMDLQYAMLRAEKTLNVQVGSAEN